MTNVSFKDISFSNPTPKVTFTPTTFTTHRKTKTTVNICRKGSIVKERCKQLTDLIAELFPDRVLSDLDLVCLIQDYIGGDRETIRAYKGYSGHVRAGRCGDNRIVGLSRKGYLEAFGFLVKVPGRRWMLAQAVLSPKGMGKVDSGFGTKEKIYLSAVNGEVAVEQSVLSEKVTCSSRLEEEEGTEKERYFSPMISPMILEELAVLKARPREEPDKAKVSWGES